MFIKIPTKDVILRRSDIVRIYIKCTGYAKYNVIIDTECGFNYSFQYEKESQAQELLGLIWDELQKVSEI